MTSFISPDSISTSSCVALKRIVRRIGASVAVGQRLARRGQLAVAEDVFFLPVDERPASAPGRETAHLRPRVEERRARLAHWKTISPPPVLGTPTASGSGPTSLLEAANARFFGGPPREAGSAGEVRGHGGSRGRAIGRARVVRTLDEAMALQPGEVLVCPTTTPAWTPLFAVAAAVVTETGGILSHCAVVAREFGIPAVVGAPGATTRIRTGQSISVDGSTGVVTLEWSGGETWP